LVNRIELRRTLNKPRINYMPDFNALLNIPNVKSILKVLSCAKYRTSCATMVNINQTGTKQVFKGRPKSEKNGSSLNLSSEVNITIEQYGK